MVLLPAYCIKRASREACPVLSLKLYRPVGPAAASAKVGRLVLWWREGRGELASAPGERCLGRRREQARAAVRGVQVFGEGDLDPRQSGCQFDEDNPNLTGDAHKRWSLGFHVGRAARRWNSLTFKANKPHNLKAGHNFASQPRNRIVFM